jgi:signal transduction histidine kinase
MALPLATIQDKLRTAQGNDRINLLLELCRIPAFWGNEDEEWLLNESMAFAGPYLAEVLLMKARYYCRKGDFAKATELLEQISGIVKSKSDNNLNVQVQLERTRIFFRTAQYEAARELAEQVIAMTAESEIITEALRIIAGVLEREGKFYEAIECSNEALDKSYMCDDRSGEAAVLCLRGGIYDELGDYQQASKDHFRSLEIYEAYGDRYKIAEVRNYIGNIYWKQSNHPEALKNYLLSLKLRREIGDVPGMGVCYNNIANIYSNLGNYDEALKYYALSLPIFEQTGHLKGTSASNYGIGIAYHELGNYDEALKYHLRALEIRNQAGDESEIGNSYNYIGNIYAAMGIYQEALRYQLMALDKAEKIGAKRSIGNSFSSIGRTYFMMEEYEDAIRYLQEGYEVGKEIGEKFIERETLHTLFEIFRKQRDFERALIYYEKYVEVNNQIAGERTQMELNKLNLQYSMEMKEKEALLLKEKNEEALRHAHKLQISNNELKQFAHVAAHDLREPLRMITGYMSLLHKSLGSSLNEQQKEFIQYALDGSRRMELLMQNMLRLAKVDANPKIERIEIDSVIEEIKLNLQALIVEKNAVVEYMPGLVIAADRTQMLQLFQNIISNGIKYNESARPTIQVSFQFSDDLLLLSVADNGIGIPANYRESAFHIFERVPTEKEYAGSGIGLAICKKIVGSMNGHIWAEDTPGGGTTFKMSFPKDVYQSG